MKIYSEQIKFFLFIVTGLFFYTYGVNNPIYFILGCLLLGLSYRFYGSYILRKHKEGKNDI